MARPATTHSTAPPAQGAPPRPPVPAETGDAAEGDVEAILEVLADAFAPFAGRFRPTALRQTPRSVREGLDRWAVARVDGRVVACAMWYPQGGAMIFCFLAVPSALRGRGYAAALVDALVERARTAGYGQVRVILRRTLRANVRYFTARGFRYLEPYGTGAHDVYHLPLA